MQLVGQRLVQQRAGVQLGGVAARSNREGWTTQTNGRDALGQKCARLKASWGILASAMKASLTAASGRQLSLVTNLGRPTMKASLTSLGIFFFYFDNEGQLWLVKEFWVFSI